MASSFRTPSRLIRRIPFLAQASPPLWTAGEAFLAFPRTCFVSWPLFAALTALTTTSRHLARRFRAHQFPMSQPQVPGIIIFFFFFYPISARLLSCSIKSMCQYLLHPSHCCHSLHLLPPPPVRVASSITYNFPSYDLKTPFAPVRYKLLYLAFDPPSVYGVMGEPSGVTV